VKRVRYRGGILEFQVPDDWVEEPAEGGAAYYSDQPGTGTLRLRTITAQPPEPVESRHVLEAAASGADPDDPPPDVLPNGNAIRSFWRDGSEGGVPVRVRYWQLAAAAPPTTVRIATFSFTIPPGHSPERTLAVLDREIRSAEFTQLTAEQVQTSLQRESKPWWKVW